MAILHEVLTCVRSRCPLLTEKDACGVVRAMMNAGETGAVAAVSAAVNGQPNALAPANGASAAASKAVLKAAGALEGAAGASEL